MIDEALAERLSRYLDGDLGASEAAELEVLLESEAEVADELDALRRLQVAVRLSADRMEPPDALDALLEPLRTGEPHAPRRVHPAVRWIGLAASVALAVTVAMEVARQRPDLPTSSRPYAPSPAPPPGESEFFQLKPLPTSPVPPEEELVGATDRLLASEPAEPDFDEPEALDVRGPLSAPAVKDEPAAKKEKADRSVGLEAGRLNDEDRKQAEVGTRGDAAAAPGVPATAMRATAAEEKSLHRRDAPAAVAVLESEDGSTVAVIDLALDLSALPVEVTVVAGRIEQVHRIAGVGDLAAVSDLLVGYETPGVADGRYRIISGGRGAPGSVVAQ